MGSLDEKEAVAALDAATGKTLLRQLHVAQDSALIQQTVDDALQKLSSTFNPAGSVNVAGFASP